MPNQPVTLQAVRPERFQRAQLLVRMLIVAVPSMLGLSAWPFGLLYLGLPLVAAVLLTYEPGERFIATDAPRLSRVLVWLFELLAYLTFVIDRFPIRTAAADPGLVRILITPQGAPTIQSALLRLLTSIPSALALMLCGLVSCLVTLAAAVWVLVSASYPKAWWGFQLAVLRWHTRLFAYHASLVDSYPPFALDSSPDESQPTTNSVAIQH